MNSGPGNVGCFIMEKHHNNAQLPRFAGGDITKNAVSNGTNFDPFMVPMVGKSVIYISSCAYLASVEMFEMNGFFDSKKK
jgi:kynureninase